MAMANTLAYYDTAIIMTVKSFIAQTPEKVVKRATPGRKILSSNFVYTKIMFWCQKCF